MIATYQTEGKPVQNFLLYFGKPKGVNLLCNKNKQEYSMKNKLYLIWKFDPLA